MLRALRLGRESVDARIHQMRPGPFVQAAPQALFGCENRLDQLVLAERCRPVDAVGRRGVEDDPVVDGAGAHRGAGKQRQRKHLRLAGEAMLLEKVDSAQHVLGRVAGKPDDQIDEQLDSLGVQHPRCLGDARRRSAAAHALERFAVDGLQPDLQPIESRLLELSRLLRREPLRPDFGKERQRARRVLASQRVEEGLEAGTVVEGRIEEDHLAGPAVAQRADQRGARVDIQHAEHARGAGIEAERAMRPATPHGLYVRRAMRFHRHQMREVGRRVVGQREARRRLRRERGESQRSPDGDAGKSGRVVAVQQRRHDAREGILRLAGDRDVRAGLLEDEGVVGTDLRTTDENLRPRRPSFHLAGEMQAALAVPQVEREPDELRLFARDPVGKERISEYVGRRRLEDLDLETPVQPVDTGGDAEASRGERNVAGGCQRSRRRHRELDEAELRHGGSIVEPCSR